jgi:hypothetical protein
MEESDVTHSKHRPSYFTPKVKFTAEEDVLLNQAVSALGAGDWKAISKRVATRNPRQCRERWKNYLNPDVASNIPWTKAEDDALLLKYQEIGPRWTTLASFFPARSTNHVKNRYHAITNTKRSNGTHPNRPSESECPQTGRSPAHEVPGSDLRLDQLLFLERGKNEIEFMLALQVDPVSNWNGF